VLLGDILLELDLDRFHLPRFLIDLKVCHLAQSDPLGAENFLSDDVFGQQL
jgi:hypothetical protein